MREMRENMYCTKISTFTVDIMVSDEILSPALVPPLPVTGVGKHYLSHKLSKKSAESSLIKNHFMGVITNLYL